MTRRSGKHTIHDQLEHQKRHQRALRIVHEIPIPHPLLALGADLVLLALRVALGDQLAAIEVIAQVLGDGAGLGQHQRLVGVLGLDGDDGRLAKGVDLLELWGCEHIRAALECLQLVGDAEFFEEPEDALGARLLEPREVSNDFGRYGSGGDEPVESDLCAFVCVGHLESYFNSLRISKVNEVECETRELCL